MTDELIGRRIGGYAIIEPIGRGGMATVYRAHQISMNRQVALKILPRQFLNDDTYIQRFIREAQIVAQLEHRNIVPVHDYGDFEGQPYLVMRLMSGGSVDDLLRHGALPAERISDIVSQIAPALDYAHSRGVLHRDLKPSNILMDDDGGAYLTDFGIARMMGDTNNLTITTQGVVGTPSYMSPEQAQGKPLDGRSDIYALGVTMFEMATGVRPFESDTPYGTAVLQVTAQPPAPRSLKAEILPTVESVILTALKKRPEDRYQSAAQVADALADALNNNVGVYDTQPGFRRPDLQLTQPNHVPPPVTPPPNTMTPPPPVAGSGTGTGTNSMYPVRPRTTRRRGEWLFSVLLGVVIGGAVLTVLVIIVALLLSRASSPEPTLTPRGFEAGVSTTDGANPTLALAATADWTSASAPTVTPVARSTPTQPQLSVEDASASVLASTVVYFAERSNNFNLFRRVLSESFDRQLTFNAAAEIYPAVSPDGEMVAFMSDDEGDFDIYVIAVSGGRIVKLTDNNVTDRVPAWSPDGEWIIFSSDVRRDGAHDLYRIRPDGSDLTLVYSADERSSSPQYSPDGRYIVFTGGSPADGRTWEIRLLDTLTEEVRTLTQNAVKDWMPSFTPDGDILYLTEGEGYAAIAQMSIDGGDPRVIYDGAGYESSAALHPSGTALLFQSDVTRRDELYLFDLTDPDAEPVQITEGGGMYGVWVP